MEKLIVTLLTILYLGLFTACEREYEIDFGDQEQSFAIFSLFSPNGIFINEADFIVDISATQSILDNTTSKIIDDAIVSITTSPLDNPDERLTENLDLLIKDNERVEFIAKEIVPKDGFEYELRVEHPDYPTATAKSVIPNKTEIIDVELGNFKESKNDLVFETDTRYSTIAEIDIENNTLVDNHFHLLVWYLDGIWLPINIEKDVLQEQLGTDATIVNLEDSEVFFGAHFSDNNFSGDSQKLNFAISFILADFQNPSKIKVELRSVSEEYHNYFVEGFRLSQAGSNAFISGSENISNNVNGGFGVFAGYSSFDTDVPFRR